MNDDEKLGDDLDRVRELLSDAEDDDRMNDWENQFLDDLREQVDEYGADTFVTEKMWAVLQRIQDKLHQ